jgi:hypothetical protein
MIGIHGNYQADGDVVENLRFHNLDVLEENGFVPNFYGTLAILCGDNNIVRNVDFDDIRVEHIREAGGNLIRLAFSHFGPSTTLGREIDNINFKNITYSGMADSVILGSAGHPIQGVTFDNLVINGERITSAEQGKISIGENVTGVSFK